MLSIPPTPDYCFDGCLIPLNPGYLLGSAGVVSAVAVVYFGGPPLLTIGLVTLAAGSVACGTSYTAATLFTEIFISVVTFGMCLFLSGLLYDVFSDGSLVADMANHVFEWLTT